MAFVAFALLLVTIFIVISLFFVKSSEIRMALVSAAIFILFAGITVFISLALFR